MSEQPHEQPGQPQPHAHAQPRIPPPPQQQPVINVHIQPPAPPGPPPPPPAPQPVAVPANNDGNWHIAHLVITIFTCGAWAPVWIVHAIVMASRKPVVPPPPQPWNPNARPLPPEHTNQMAVQAVAARARRRAEARHLAHQNPLMARELSIGRTDMPADRRPYDDGGLIDVNMVPANEFTRFGIDPETARRIVEIREQAGGFSSAEDLATVADLPPKLLPELIEYGLYLR
ncbi:ComEA family DNA-binding protein [Actinomadura kijaniata]|uniref:ComEA family DNA-binding protein n=1 Tax=Actinomadura kijaniata TaxID=46161 RepID=UPI00082F68B4|nr:helix-hairpin-helix domain-containing protein [Actinomadura kijaniata]